MDIDQKTADVMRSHIGKRSNLIGITPMEIDSQFRAVKLKGTLGEATRSAIEQKHIERVQEQNITSSSLCRQIHSLHIGDGYTIYSRDKAGKLLYIVVRW